MNKRRKLDKRAPETPPAKRPRYTLNLTVFELVHLRDLFGVLLPADTSRTLSQALAAIEERPMVEARLWQKVANKCREANVPLDDDAPDFVCAPAGPPPMSVFRLADEPAAPEDVPEASSLFADQPCDSCGTVHETEAQKNDCLGETEPTGKKNG